MDPVVYYVLHVASILFLTAFTFQAFANPAPEKRGKTMMMTGILSLVVFVSGFGLISKMGHAFVDPWVLIKLVCWLALSALSGIAFRKPEKVGALTLIASLALILAVLSVYVIRNTAA